jgi:ribosome biogenesis protein SSF1/2
MPRRGGRRKKSRTQDQPDRPQRPEKGDTAPSKKDAPVQPKRKKGHAAPPQADNIDEKRVPRTMIVRRGATDKRTQELVRELRRVMAPHTAERLKERPGNTIKDFVHAAQPLGVSHLLCVGQQKQQVNLRVARLPGGPTLSFKVRSFALVKEVRVEQKRPFESQAAYATAPLVVLDNFCSKEKHITLQRVTFEALFAPVDVSTIKVAELRRLVLFHRDGDCVEMRHYAVQASAANISKSVKRVVEVKHIPDLSKMKDIAEYVTRIDPGSDSEGEEAVAPLAGKFAGRGNVAKRESKIKLVELGPRLRLRLYKVEKGVCEGDVLYHAFKEPIPEESDAEASDGDEEIGGGEDDDESGGDLFADEDASDDDEHADAPPPKKQRRKGAKPPF